MADIIDDANKLADLHLEVAVENAKRVTGNERLTGWCQNTGCGEGTEGAFCSAECRRDFNARERMRNG